MSPPRHEGRGAQAHGSRSPPPSASQLAQLEGRTALKAPVRALFIRSWSWDSVTKTPEDHGQPLISLSSRLGALADTTYPLHRLSVQLGAQQDS